MAGVWSEQRKLERWLEVELAALDAWAEIGRVPAEAAEAIRHAAVAPTPERVREIEERTHHDVAAFVDAVADGLGEHGRWFHYGLTSSDVLDTALSLQIQEAGRLIVEGIDRAFTAVVRRAMPVMGTIAQFAVVHRNPVAAHAAIDSAAAELVWVERTMTRFTRL